MTDVETLQVNRPVLGDGDQGESENNSVETQENVRHTRATSSSSSSTSGGEGLASISSPVSAVSSAVPKRAWVDCHPLAVERSNLIHVLNLVIKELIDVAVNFRSSSGNVVRHINELDPRLTHMFNIVEHCICHGLKGIFLGVGQATSTDRSLGGSGAGGVLESSLGAALRWAGNAVFQESGTEPPWNLMHLLVKVCPEAMDLCRTVSELVHSANVPPQASFGGGRCSNALLKLRVWLRLALMQKRLGEYLRFLIDNRHRLRLQELYHPEALLLQEEGTVMAGLLLGLNVVDVTFLLKDVSHLVYPSLSPINYTAFMKKAYEDGLTDRSELHEDESEELRHLLDQKNYLEELNEHHRQTIEQLQRRLSHSETSLHSLKEEMAILRNENILLVEQNSLMHAEKASLESEFSRQRKVLELDIQTERDTYQTSRVGLDQLNADLRRQLQEETELRLEAQRALEAEVKRKVNDEQATSSMESQLLEKMTVINALRKQVDDVKAIQVETATKLRDCDESLRHKTLLVTRLEEKTAGMSEMLDTSEKQLQLLQEAKRNLEDENRRQLNKLAMLESQCADFEADQKIQAEVRNNLQHQCNTLRKEKEAFREKVAHLEVSKEECTRLRQQMENLQERCSEQEKALEEMADHLRQSKLDADRLRETHAVVQEAQWADDKEVTECRQCRKSFSVSRRKHHCRHCGGIFCNECSLNKITLASSANPVRVCNSCHTTLLQRYITR